MQDKSGPENMSNLVLKYTCYNETSAKPVVTLGNYRCEREKNMISNLGK